ncbi:MAG: ATP-dependent RecD-like DNA helicase [Bacteroidota bacterium]|jgi:exodeoxyribonuclease-5
MPTAPAITYSPQQLRAIQLAEAWLANPKGVFRIDGKAGTGKTTCTQVLVRKAQNPCFLTITGKAASRQRAKGNPAATIHSKIYRCFAVEDPKTRRTTIRFSLNRDSDIVAHDLIVIDESSMVPTRIAEDLLSFNRPILVLGDPAQLPPVKAAESFFMTEVRPAITLTEVHRQALDSPILQLADWASESRPIPLGEYGSSRVVPRLLLEDVDYLRSTQVLCGRNNTRHSLNATIRRLTHPSLHLPPTPIVGDRLICLRNDHELGLLNGVQYVVLTVYPSDSPAFINMRLRPEFDPILPDIDVSAHACYFTHPGSEPSFDESKLASHFDFGYAITVHKAQGSEWRTVTIIDESHVFRQHARNWLYTAITRAEESVLIGR